MRRFVFYFSLLLFCIQTSLQLKAETPKACECPLSNLSLKTCEAYEIIFKGLVLEVKACGHKPGEALFEVQELYKGNARKQFKVLFDCESDCAYLFKPGEEWIIYSRYRQVNIAQMDWCSRSRRFFRNDREDYYAATYGNSYEEEYAFLRKELGLHRLLANDQGASQGRNLVPDTNQSVIILLVSIAGLLLFYYLFKRFLK
ncbi:MAG TPA: hypothetical protein PLQ93_04360 [Bacteroidia bacterium]|nr:hypothetical protein [Bacteroidia bacterium]